MALDKPNEMEAEEEEEEEEKDQVSGGIYIVAHWWGCRRCGHTIV